MGSMQVAELLVGVAAPVLYWEQGHEWLFGDPVRFQAGSSLVRDPTEPLSSRQRWSCRAPAAALLDQQGSRSSPK